MIDALQPRGTIGGPVRTGNFGPTNGWVVLVTWAGDSAGAAAVAACVPGAA